MKFISLCLSLLSYYRVGFSGYLINFIGGLFMIVHRSILAELEGANTTFFCILTLCLN